MSSSPMSPGVVYYEDIDPDQVRVSPTPYVLGEQEIIEYATRWDPQPFHIDPEAAARLTGGIIASSAHTFAISARLANQLADGVTAVIAGLGWTNVQLPHPARPGDELRAVTSIVSKRLSESRPGSGVVVSGVKLVNQRDETVMSYEISTLVAQRPTGN